MLSDDSQESTQQPSLDIRPIVPCSRPPYTPAAPEHSHSHSQLVHKSSYHPCSSPDQNVSSLSFSDDRSCEESVQSGIQWTQPVGVYSPIGETQGEGSREGGDGGKRGEAMALVRLDVIPEGSAGENTSNPRPSESTLHPPPVAAPSSLPESHIPGGASLPEQPPANADSPPDDRGPQVDAEPESDPTLDEPPSIPTPQPSQGASHSPSPPRLRSSSATTLQLMNGNGNKTPPHMSPISRFSVRSGSSSVGGSGSGRGKAKRFGAMGTARLARFTKPAPEPPVPVLKTCEPSHEDEEDDRLGQERVGNKRERGPTEKLEKILRSASQGEMEKEVRWKGKGKGNGKMKDSEEWKRNSGGKARKDTESDQEEEDDLNWSDGTTSVRGRATTVDYEEGPTSPTPSRGDPLSNHRFPSSPPPSNGEAPAAQHVPTPPSQPSHPSQHSSRSSLSQQEGGSRRNGVRSPSPVPRRARGFGGFDSTASMGERDLDDGVGHLFSSQAVSDEMNLEREETATQRSPEFQATQVVVHQSSSPLLSSSQHLSAGVLEPTQTGSVDDPMDDGEPTTRSTPAPQILPPVPIYRTLGFSSHHASSSSIAPPQPSPPAEPAMESTQLDTQMDSQVNHSSSSHCAPAELAELVEPALPPRQRLQLHVPAHRLLSNTSRHTSVASVATSAQVDVPPHRLLTRRRSRTGDRSREAFADGAGGRVEEAHQVNGEERTQVDGERTQVDDEESTQVNNESAGPATGPPPHHFLRPSPEPMDLDEPPVPSANFEASANQAVEEELEDDTDISDPAPSPPSFDDLDARPLLPRSPLLQLGVGRRQRLALRTASRLSLGGEARPTWPPDAGTGPNAGDDAGAGERSLPSHPLAPPPTKTGHVSSYTGRVRKKRQIYSPSSPSPEPGTSPIAGPSRAQKRVESESKDEGGSESESSSAPEDSEDYTYHPSVGIGAVTKKPASVRGGGQVMALELSAKSHMGVDAFEGKRKRKTTSPLTALMSDSDESSSAPEDPADETFRLTKKGGVEKGKEREKAAKQEKLDNASAKGKGAGKKRGKGGNEVAPRDGRAAGVNDICNGKGKEKARKVTRDGSVADSGGGGSRQANKRIKLTLKDQPPPAPSCTPSSSAQPSQSRVLAAHRIHFYPARITSRGPKGYNGVYYDKTPYSNLSGDKLRDLKIRSGDVLEGIDLVGLPKTLEVKEDWDGSEEGVKCWSQGKLIGRVKLQYIRIHKNIVRAHFGDRLFDPSTALGVLGPLNAPDTKPKNPSPTKAVFATPSKPGASRIFKDMVFLLTSGDEEGNRSVAEQIRANGGAVADDWPRLFDPGSAWGAGFARGLAATPFVVVPASTKASMTPKFMVALAKGIPILSAKFVEVSIERKEAVKWQPYLVSSGFSEFTQHMMSQRVDLAWGEEGWNMGKAAHAYRPFANKNVLFVLPSKSKWMKTLVPCCLANLGVADLKLLSNYLSSTNDMIDPKWDYVVVDNRERGGVPEVLDGDERMGNINWLKQCLIMGEALPPSMKMESAKRDD